MFFKALAGTAVLLGVLGASESSARADDAALHYPTRQVRIIVPYPAGSLIDLFGRLIAERLQGSLGQPFIVENRPGGSTLTGARQVSGADKDGYTLLVPTVTTLSIAPHIFPKLGVDPVKDFTPIARLAASNFFLVVRDTFPAKTMREWIDEVRSKPGKYVYASSGVGTPHHIFMELLKKELGLDLVHVPYKGGGDAVPDLLTGRIDIAFLDGTQAVPHVQSGKLRALGTTLARRTDLIDGVPAIAETVPGFDWSGWVAFAGPAGMPKPVVERIAAEIARLQAAPEYAELLRKGLMEATPPLSADETAAFVRNEFARWGPIIESSGAVIP
jgi:tripartite-type tricarboxylate transporter receptor subunit TctC